MAKQLISINKDIFKEYDIRGRYPADFDAEAVKIIAKSFFLEYRVKTLILGRDRRAESLLLRQAINKEATKLGIRVYDLGVAGTPTLFFALGSGDYDGGIMITASHSPKGIAGMKFGLKNGQAVSGLALKKLIDKHKEAGISRKKSVRAASAGLDRRIINQYCHHALSYIKPGKLEKFRIVADASGGSGAALTTALFARLPITAIKMNFAAGDKYPDHDLNPLLPESQRAIIAQVRKNKADLGVIFDGDADRVVLLDESGQAVHPYYLNCLVARIYLQKFGRQKIAIDGRLILGITETIKAAGGKPIVGRSGWANFFSLMKRQRINFGCENSGHFFFSLKSQKSTNVFGDSLIPVLLVLEYLSQSGQSMSQAIKLFSDQYALSGEINLRGIDFGESAGKIAAHFRRYRQTKTDGLSIIGPDWFINLRPSKTEALVRLNIEARKKPVVKKIKKELLKLIN